MQEGTRNPRPGPESQPTPDEVKAYAITNGSSGAGRHFAATACRAACDMIDALEWLNSVRRDENPMRNRATEIDGYGLEALEAVMGLGEIDRAIEVLLEALEALQTAGTADVDRLEGLRRRAMILGGETQELVDEVPIHLWIEELRELQPLLGGSSTV